jgi:hypothetical protein
MREVQISLTDKSFESDQATQLEPGAKLEVAHSRDLMAWNRLVHSA